MGVRPGRHLRRVHTRTGLRTVLVNPNIKRHYQKREPTEMEKMGLKEGDIMVLLPRPKKAAERTVGLSLKDLPGLAKTGAERAEQARRAEVQALAYERFLEAQKERVASLERARRAAFVREQELLGAELEEFINPSKRRR